MRPIAPTFLGLLVGAAACLLLTWLGAGLQIPIYRECYRFAERIGIMTPGGPLGGQVGGFNFQRNPEWVHPVARGLAWSLAAMPGALAGLLVLHRIARGRFALSSTTCGQCGGVLQGLRTPDEGPLLCPHCGRAL